jgi:hypothetical protein
MLRATPAPQASHQAVVLHVAALLLGPHQSATHSSAKLQHRYVRRNMLTLQLAGLQAITTTVQC